MSKRSKPRGIFSVMGSREQKKQRWKKKRGGGGVPLIHRSRHPLYQAHLIVVVCVRTEISPAEVGKVEERRTNPNLGRVGTKRPQAKLSSCLLFFYDAHFIHYPR